MEINPLFSILIASYNNGKFFEDCYNSIMAQSYQNFEVIIVDDCSTDNSIEIIKNKIGDDARFKIFENEKNSGVGFTKTRCSGLATGEICAFLDPDDAITENALEISVKTHNENPDVALVYTDSFWCKETFEKPYRHNYKQVENGNPYFFNQAEIFHFASYKNEFYKKTEGTDPTLKRAIDQDLYLKLYDVGKVLHIPEAIYYYRIHEGGISTTKNVKKAYFWHWVVIIDSAKRRGINIEDEFWDEFILKKDFKKFQNRKWVKLGYKIGMLD